LHSLTSFNINPFKSGGEKEDRKTLKREIDRILNHQLSRSVLDQVIYENFLDRNQLFLFYTLLIMTMIPLKGNFVIARATLDYWDITDPISEIRGFLDQEEVNRIKNNDRVQKLLLTPFEAMRHFINS
tara:strand:- start:66150 stop:66533 length:384 start_codon:yes stop_codon:yes gene_type:complete